MASIERTAYPRFPRTLTLKDLQASFTPRAEEIEWASRYARRPDRCLSLLVLLKCFQFLRYFPAPEAIPSAVVEHVAATLGMQPTTNVLQYPESLDSLYRHHRAIRELLHVQPQPSIRCGPRARPRAARGWGRTMIVPPATVDTLSRSTYS